MSTIIDKLKDKFGNFVLPITNTKAVYDNDGNRLDGVLNNINSSLVEITNADHYADAPLNQIIIQWVNKYAPTVGNKNVMGSIENSEGKYHVSAYIDRYKNATGILTQYGGENIIFTCYGGSLTEINPLASVKTISDAFDLSKTYSQGEFCIYDNTLWKSKVNSNTGNTPTEGIYWEATNIGNELGKYMVAYVDAPELGEGFRFVFLRLGKTVMVTCASSIGSQIVPWHFLNVIIPEGFRPVIEAPYRDQDANGYFTIFMNPNGSIGVEASNNKLIRMTLTYIVKE